MIKVDCRDLAMHLRTLEGSVLLALLDETQDFCFIKDCDSHFLYSNRAHLEAMGRRREEVIGKTDFELAAPHLAEGYFADETRVFATRLPIIRIQETITPHGERFHVSTFKVPISDLQGNLLGLAGFSRKIPNPADVEGVAMIKRQIADLLRRLAGKGASPSQVRALEVSLFAAIDDRKQYLPPVYRPELLEPR